MLDHNNLEEFYDPPNYDIEEQAYPTHDATVAFYGDLAQQSGAPILELACGTGRVTIPIARTGLAVVGVDLATEMLAWAREKSVGLPAAWFHGDIRTVRLGRAFRLIYITGNAFQAMLTQQDQEQFLATVQAHLAPGGYFAFETRNPRPADLVTIPEEEFWQAYQAVSGHTVRISGVQRYDPATQIMHWTTFRRWQEPSGPHEKVTRIAVRYTPVAELNQLLHTNGFTVHHQYGFWDKRPLTAESPTIITVCTRGTG